MTLDLRRRLPASWRARLVSIEIFDWREATNAALTSGWIVVAAVVVIAAIAVVMEFAE